MVHGISQNFPFIIHHSSAGWALGRGNPKNTSKKKLEQPIKKKKKIMGVKKKTWAAHGRRAHEIKKRNMGVKKKKT